MAKAPKKTANVAQTTLAKIAGLLVEASGDADVAAVLEAAGLTVAAKGKGKADKKAKPEPKAAKGKKKKITAAQIVEAIEEGESLDLEGVDEEILREAVIAAKLATKKKAGSLDEEELLELLNEELGGDDEDGDDDEEDEEDDSDDDSDDEDGDDEDDEDDSDDEDEDGDDEDDEDDESPDLDEMDEDELRELAVSEKVFTKAQAKKKDEDELREALEEHFGGDDEDGDEDGDDDEEDEDDEDDEDGQDLEDLDEDQLRALAIEEGVFTKAQAKKKDEDELREALEEHFGGEDDEDDEDFDDEDEDEDEDE